MQTAARPDVLVRPESDLAYHFCVQPFWASQTTENSEPAHYSGPLAVQCARRVRVGAWVYPGSNEQRNDAVAALAKRGVVLLGESHDQAEHHRWQLHTITALFSHRPDMVLGFEMFPRRVQRFISDNGHDRCALLSSYDV